MIVKFEVTFGVGTVKGELEIVDVGVFMAIRAYNCG